MHNQDTKYNLKFVKPGDQHKMTDYQGLSQVTAFEVIRDRLGMGWILVEISTERV